MVQSIPYQWRRSLHAVQLNASTALRTRMVMGGFAITAVMLLFLQKFGLPMPNASLGINTPLIWLCLALLAVTARLEVAPVRLLLFTLFCATASAGMMIAAQPFKATAFELVVALYLPLCFRLRVSEAIAWRCIAIFQKLALAVALIVIAQQVAQYTIGNRFWPNLDAIVPVAFQYTGFAYIHPYAWGSPYLKPNAIFFLEASAVSYCLGVALVVELVRFRRLAYLTPLAVAMFATLAGTGPLLLVLAAPLWVATLDRRWLILFVVIGVPLLVVAGALGYLDVFLSRTSELSDPKMSGYSRVTAPVQAIAQMLADPDLFFHGMGPGSSPIGDNVVQWPFSKVGYEYGVLSAILFHIFLFYAMFDRPPSRVIAYAVLLPHLLFGGGFASHFNIGLLLLLGTLLSVEPTRRPTYADAG